MQRVELHRRERQYAASDPQQEGKGHDVTVAKRVVKPSLNLPTHQHSLRLKKVVKRAQLMLRKQDLERQNLVA